MLVLFKLGQERTKGDMDSPQRQFAAMQPPRVSLTW